MKTMYIIAVIILILIGVFYFLFPWNWSKYNPKWTIKSDQEISKVSYTISTENDSNIVTAVVYIKTDEENMRLNPKDTITVNGKIMNPEYYNNGVAVGYNYILDIEKSDKYMLLVKRPGREDIMRTIQPAQFSTVIPDKISKRGAPIEYASDINVEHILVEFRSISGEFVTKDESLMQRLLKVECIIKDGKIILDPKSLAQLKNGAVKVNISNVFYQKDGTYAVNYEKKVEIID